MGFSDEQKKSIFLDKGYHSKGDRPLAEITKARQVMPDEDYTKDKIWGRVKRLPGWRQFLNKIKDLFSRLSWVRNKEKNNISKFKKI